MAIFPPQIVKNYQHLVLFIVYCANRFKVEIQGFNKVAKSKTRKKFLESSITPITVHSSWYSLTVKYQIWRWETLWDLMDYGILHELLRSPNRQIIGVVEICNCVTTRMSATFCKTHTEKSIL